MLNSQISKILSQNLNKHAPKKMEVRKKLSDNL